MKQTELNDSNNSIDEPEDLYSEHQPVPNQNKLWKIFSSNEFHNVSIIAFTFGLFITSILLWNAQKENTTISQRAWIYISGAEQNNKSSVSNKFATILVLKNAGNTPAINLKVLCNSDIKEKPPENFFDHKNSGKDARGRLIGPQESISLLSESNLEWSSDIFDEIDKGTKRYYTWGVVEYMDVFNEKRITEFCFESRADSILMEPCNKMNKMY